MSDLLLALLLPLLALIAVTDARRGIIPDRANLAVAALGALAAATGGGAALTAGRALDALIVGGLLLLLRAAYRMRRGRTGLGLGDVKFLAAATLWLGMTQLFAALFLASTGGLAFLGALALGGRPVGRHTRLRFGPFLALGVGAVLIWARLGPR